MEKLGLALGTLVTAAFIVLVGATLHGTVLWILYPHIHSLFPTAASSGVITPTLGWWDSVCITWITSIIFKNYQVSTKTNQ
jgi:hypothetical protein